MVVLRKESNIPTMQGYYTSTFQTEVTGEICLCNGTMQNSSLNQLQFFSFSLLEPVLKQYFEIKHLYALFVLWKHKHWPATNQHLYLKSQVLTTKSVHARTTRGFKSKQKGVLEHERADCCFREVPDMHLHTF